MKKGDLVWVPGVVESMEPRNRAQVYVQSLGWFYVRDVKPRRAKRRSVKP